MEFIERQLPVNATNTDLRKFVKGGEIGKSLYSAF
jgi:hypothetical protein